MYQSLLNKIELAGNKLPHPTTLFVLFSIAIIFLSALLSGLDWVVSHPLTDDRLSVRNLLSRDGLVWMITHAVSNFTGFAPVGTVLVAMLGIGIAEYSGLLKTALKPLVLYASSSLLTSVLVFTGILSSLAADAGYVVLIPLGAAIFLSAGRHPIAGIAATFAGVSGGFSANLMIGPVDAILAGISTEAAQLIEPSYEVSIASNYYFMCLLTVLLTLVGTWVTERVVIPRLGSYHAVKVEIVSESKLSEIEKKGLRNAGFGLLIWVFVVLCLTVPETGILRHPETGSLLKSPFISGLILIISIGFAISGIAFGVTTQTIKSDKDVVQGMEASMQTMAGYIVLMFFAAQFVSFFSWTQIGVMTAVEAAEILKQMSIPPLLVLIVFIAVTAVVNLLIGSASAKWALLAPVFIPLFMLIGMDPETVQAGYRIADSSTNIITPLMPYFGVVVAFVHKYDSSAGLGTLAAIMLPYALSFFLAGTSLLLLWHWFGFPLGI